MASGTPVIALERPVSRCVIDHGIDGLLVPNTIEGLQSALVELLNNPDKADDMGRAGQTKVALRFAWHVVTQQIMDVYAKADAEPVALLQKAG